MERIERMLSMWIEYQQTKAQSIYDDLTVEAGAGKTFQASLGCFMCFRKHYNYHNIRGLGGLLLLMVQLKISWKPSRPSLRNAVTLQSRCIMRMRPDCFGKEYLLRTYISCVDKTTPRFKVCYFLLCTVCTL